MKKILGVIILGLLWCNTSFGATTEMKCARHLTYYVDVDRNVVTEELFYSKKKGSTELKKKPTVTAYPIEKYSSESIITSYANFRYGWNNFAQKLVFDLSDKTVSGHGFKASVETMNKYNYWEKYSDPALNIRYEFAYKCPGLKVLNIKNSGSTNNSNTKKLSLDEIKKTCSSFGYKEGTEKFADCAKALFLKQK